MSKTTKTAKPEAEWRVHYSGGEAAVGRSSLHRDADGGYTFRDSAGIVADFPPGTVLCALRTKVDADPGPIETGAP